MEIKQIELGQKIRGFGGFIGSWICKGDLNIVVDVGPRSSVHSLVDTLKAEGLRRIDLVLLTHIHLDHAGGLKEFLDCFPSARVICHRKGVSHLLDPTRLWEGSLNVLGKTAEAYGKMEPVPGDRLISHEDAKIDNLEIIETPGHAPHHLSFCYLGNLFAGEAAGNYFKIKGKEYVRPATPPRFFLNECVRSVNRLLELEDQIIRYAHFGEAVSSHDMLERYKKQLLLWKEVVQQEISGEETVIIENCTKRLLRDDPELSAFIFMSDEMQSRERAFMANSIKGYLGYLTGVV